MSASDPVPHRLRLNRTLPWVLMAVLFLAAPGRADVLRRDLRGLFTYGNLGWTALGLGAAGLAHQWDDEIRGSLDGALVPERTEGTTNFYASSRFVLPASFGLWLSARAAHRPKLEALSSDLLRTLGFVQVIITPIKIGTHRRRPDRSNHRSFPSGHTTNSFAIARLLHRHYGLRLGAPFYALAALVAAGRLEDDVHFFSDVVAGAALGTIVGSSVSLAAVRKLQVSPVGLGGGGMAMQLRWLF